MTDKQNLITLHHPSDPKAKVTVNEDHAQAYLDSGWSEKDDKK
jgi:hypothetical protein